MKKDLLIVHGGGPTAVINCSLYGAIKEAKTHTEIGRILGARNGTGGVLKEDFIDLGALFDERLELLKQTPGSAIGTSRDELESEEYRKMAMILDKTGIGYVLFNGGNGTMDTCGKLCKTCRKLGLDIRVMGIPKTQDNDIAVTDHSPGFPSSALYFARSVKELCADVKGLPIHVVVIEASGRNAGWTTAASALAMDEDGLGPDLIYLPERPFHEEQFIEDVQERLKVKSGIVVVASEGLKNEEGKPIVKPIFKSGRATYFGDVSSHLANLVVEKLGYKARNEKPGLLGRASIAMQSRVDREEAILAGEEACRAVIHGESGKMVAFSRISTQPYVCKTKLVDIDEVMLCEKTVPDAFINADGNGVTGAFIDWCRPLLGEQLPRMLTLNGKK